MVTGWRGKQRSSGVWACLRVSRNCTITAKVSVSVVCSCSWSSGVSTVLGVPSGWWGGEGGGAMHMDIKAVIFNTGGDGNHILNADIFMHTTHLPSTTPFLPLPPLHPPPFPLPPFPLSSSHLHTQPTTLVVLTHTSQSHHCRLQHKKTRGNELRLGEYRRKLGLVKLYLNLLQLDDSSLHNKLPASLTIQTHSSNQIDQEYKEGTWPNEWYRCQVIFT